MTLLDIDGAISRRFLMLKEHEMQILPLQRLRSTRIVENYFLPKGTSAGLEAGEVLNLGNDPAR
jgi:hypothetical protein